MKELTVAQAIELGHRIAFSLRLKDNGSYYETDNGPKTPQGLGRMVWGATDDVLKCSDLDT
jgi:hypothetical protein